MIHYIFAYAKYCILLHKYYIVLYNQFVNTQLKDVNKM